MTERVQLWQLLPALTEDEFASLKADIAARGVMVPLEFDEVGNVLDGHHRKRAWDELRADGVEVADYPRITRGGMSDDEKAEHVLALNLDRRHLTREQRRELVGKLRAQGWSLRRIGKRLGVSVGQVHADAEVFSSEHVPPTVEGSDGKSYPARVERREPTRALPGVLSTSEREQRRAEALVTEQPSVATSTVVSVSQAKKGVIDRAREERRERLAETPTGLPEELADRVTLHSVPVEELARHVAAESVDLILTDPPYPQEFIPTYAALAAFATHALKPGGSLAAMAGQSYLPEVMDALRGHGDLTYQWTLAYLTPGGQAVQVWPRRTNTFWKPVLWFTKGEYVGPWIGDVAKSDPNDNDKRFHDWGQSESGMRDLLGRLSRPGDVVCDPFLGGGTTGIVCVLSDRLFVGADADHSCVSAFCGRIKEVE